MLARDTGAEAAREHVRMVRQMGPQRRFRAAASLSESVRQLLWRTVRASMPGAEESEVKIAFMKRLYGEHLVRELGIERDR